MHDLRKADRQWGLRGEVWRRVSDAKLLDHQDLQEGLAQMRSGEFAEPVCPRLDLSPPS